MRTVILVAILVAGCGPTRPTVREAAFGPAQMRINETFTRLRDADGDERADFVEVNVELLDAYGDATKGGGTLSLDLHEYAAAGTDVRGERVGESQTYDLAGVEAQRRHWQPVVRLYRFRLPQEVEEGRYLLSAVYRPSVAETEAGEQGTRRLFDRLVVQ